MPACHAIHSARVHRDTYLSLKRLIHPSGLGRLQGLVLKVET